MSNTNYYILDFDGVIADSIVECYCMTRYTAANQAIDRSLQEIKTDSKFWTYFKSLRYLVGPAHEYLFLHQAISITDCASTDIVEKNFHSLKEKNSNLSADFSDKFFSNRQKERAKNLDRWVKLNPLFDGITNLLRKLAADRRLAISSTKDDESIKEILTHNQIELSPRNIYGASKGLDKLTHINEICAINNLVRSEVTFVDDNFNHLERVHPSGIKLFLSTWGYNHPHNAALFEKYNIVTRTLNEFLGEQ